MGHEASGVHTGQYHVFSDVTSCSRRTTDRPGMRRLLHYAITGDNIVIWRVDRLGRSLIDVLNSVNVPRRWNGYGAGRPASQPPGYSERCAASRRSVQSVSAALT